MYLNVDHMADHWSWNEAEDGDLEARITWMTKLRKKQILERMQHPMQQQQFQEWSLTICVQIEMSYKFLQYVSAVNLIILLIEYPKITS